MYAADVVGPAVAGSNVNPEDHLAYLERLEAMVYPTRLEIEARTVPPNVNWVQHLGFASPDDGGFGQWKRHGATVPSAGVYFADQAGQYFVYVPDRIGHNIRANGAGIAFGVDGTDQVAIQAMHNAAAAIASALTPQKVYVPHGARKYIFTTTSVGSHVEYEGVGGILKLADNVCVSDSTFYYPINNLGQTDTIFRNLRIDGNGAQNTLFRVADAITCVGKNSCVFGGQIDDAPDSGVTFSGTPGGICSGVLINGATDAGIYVNDSNENDPSFEGTLITNCTVQNAQIAAYSIKRSSGVITLANCSASDVGNLCTVESFGSGNGGAPSKLVISNIVGHGIGYMHRGDNIGERAFSIIGSENVTLTGCNATDVSGLGIYLSGVTKSAVTGNVVTGYQADPFPTGDGNVGLLLDARDGVPCSNTVVTGNVITDFADEGLYSKDMQHCKIAFNDFSGSAGSTGALIGAPCVDNEITSNTIAGSVQTFGVTAGASENRIERNKHVNETALARNGIRVHTATSDPNNSALPRFTGERILAGGRFWDAIGPANNQWI